MKKLFYFVVSIVGLFALLFIAKPWVIGWFMSVPTTSFADTPIPEPPNYAEPYYWAALPDRADSADWLPSNSRYADKQASAKADVFYIHPTAAFPGRYWVAGYDDLLHRKIVDWGILPQQASIFNAAGRVYAPRYRSVRMPVWTADDRDSVEGAVSLAYSDVKAAFQYYLDHYNDGRPIIIASHSQGTLHAIRLMRELFDNQPLGSRLVVAYLIGNTIPDVPWFHHIPLCHTASQTGCYVTWNTFLAGGNAEHFIDDNGLHKLDCVNPLSWEANEKSVDADRNNGSIPMMDYSVVHGALPALQKHVVGARCGPEGVLWISKVPEVAGYTAALFAGGSYHTYDFNFYYDSIRKNAVLRVQSFLSED